VGYKNVCNAYVRIRWSKEWRIVCTVVLWGIVRSFGGVCAVIGDHIRGWIRWRGWRGWIAKGVKGGWKFSDVNVGEWIWFEKCAKVENIEERKNKKITLLI
jgi:hypothetical protein